MLCVFLFFVSLSLSLSLALSRSLCVCMYVCACYPLSLSLSQGLRCPVSRSAPTSSQGFAARARRTTRTRLRCWSTPSTSRPFFSRTPNHTSEHRSSFFSKYDAAKIWSRDVFCSPHLWCRGSQPKHVSNPVIKKCTRLFIYRYSMREKTNAHRRLVDDVPQAVKIRRLQELIEVGPAIPDLN